MKKSIKMCISLLLLTLALCLTGCKNEAVSNESTNNGEGEEVVNGEGEIEDLEEEEVIPANQNLLTGVCDLTEEAIGKRPVAVMVNNVTAAMPQYGVAQADIIFEILVEGDQTRFMALYGDYTQVPEICSVRSCRKYFPIFSEGFDAVYVNWGMAEPIVPYVNSLNLTHYEGLRNTGGLFKRDQARLNAGYSLEHTGYFDGPKLAETMAKRNERTDLTEDKLGTAFVFNKLDEQLPANGDSCKNVEIEFGGVDASFEYNESSRTYLKNHNGKAQIDGKTGTQLEFTNLFILETDIWIDANGTHKDFNWSGSANSIGYYVSNGAVQKIHWMKDGVEEYLRFYDENGEELSINRGKSYIAINYIGQATFE